MSILGPTTHNLQYFSVLTWSPPPHSKQKTPPPGVLRSPGISSPRQENCASFYRFAWMSQWVQKRKTKIAVLLSRYQSRFVLTLTRKRTSVVKYWLLWWPCRLLWRLKALTTVLIHVGLIQLLLKNEIIGTSDAFNFTCNLALGKMDGDINTTNFRTWGLISEEYLCCCPMQWFCCSEILQSLLETAAEST